MLLFLLVVLLANQNHMACMGKKKMVGKETITFVIIDFLTNIPVSTWNLNFNTIITIIRTDNAYKEIDGENYSLVVFK